MRGTNPSLLEAMSASSLIIAHDNIFNKSILENEAFYFSSSEDVTALLNQNSEKADFKFMLEKNIEKIKRKYTWDHILNLMETLFKYAIRKCK